MKFIHLIRCNIRYVASEQMWRIMKLIILIMTVFLVQVSASTFGQRLTIKDNSISMREIFTQIRKQTGYIVLATSDLVNKSKPFKLDLQQVPLEDALKVILTARDLEYRIEGKSISVSEKETPSFLEKVVDAFTPPVDVKGLVLDEKGQPLPGVTVRVKGFNKATSTGNDGRFYLPGVDDDAVLEFRMVGYKVLELSAKAKFEGIRMEILPAELEEVQVAYGKTTKEAFTGSVTQVKAAQLEKQPERSFDRMLQGLVPGLQVTTGNGQPGGGTSSIILRGIGTGTDVSRGSSIRNPLFVIDGVQVIQDHVQSRIGENDVPVTNPMAQINPQDIESISVLKNATAIALYGSRASNGVILITTKQGKIGKNAISFRHQTDMASRFKGGRENVLNRDQYQELLFESYRNRTPGITDGAILSDLRKKFPVIVNKPGDTSFYQTVNWYDQLYESNAISNSSNLTFSGGTEFNKYYLNLEYTSQEGIVKKTGYDRASVRYNFLTKPVLWLDFGINSTVSYNKQQLPGFFEDGSNVPAYPYTSSPYLPVRLLDGSYQLTYKFGANGLGTTTEMPNPVAAIEYNSNTLKAYRALGNVFAQAKFLKNFDFRTNLGIDYALSNNREKQDPRLPQVSSYQSLPVIGYIEDRDITRTTLINTNTLMYNGTAGKHVLNAILGQEAQVFENKVLMAGGIGFASPEYNNVFQASTKSGETTLSRQTLLSYFAQANYTYDKKYLLSLSGRRDGASRFGVEAQYNSYWSAGLGWVMTEEKFLSENAKWINYAKLRGSIGQAGNSNSINPNTRFDVLTIKTYSGGIEGSSVITYPAVQTTKSPSNPLIKPEETLNFDLGLEASFLNNRISVTVDVYKRKINDVLYNITIPGASGGQSVLYNMGDMENKGTEVSLWADVFNTKAFKWTINGSWSTNKNKLVKANTVLQPVSTANLVNKVGENFNSFYLIRWAGVNADNGDPVWLNAKDEKVSAVTLNDRVFTGKKPQPDGFGGLTNTISYKQIELSAFLYYQYGFQIYDKALVSLLNDGGINAYVNQSVLALDRWQKPGDQAMNPKRVLSNTANGSTMARSTRYLFDGDFIRLKNVSVSYSFSPQVLQKLHARQLKVFVQGNNLALWTKYPGIDPENVNLGGESIFGYPQQRSFSIGLNVTF